MEDNNNKSSLFKRIENVIKIIMVSTFFMPWVVTVIGNEIQRYRFIGFLAGGRGSSITVEQIYNLVANHYNNLFFNILSFGALLLAVRVHFAAINDGKIIAYVLDLAVQFIMVFSSILALILEYPDYYNKINSADQYKMNAHLGWGFWLYVFMLFISIYFRLILPFFIKETGENNLTENDGE